MSKFIFGSWEINSKTANLYSRLAFDHKIDTIDTAVSYDNAYLLRGLISFRKLKVISKIAPQMWDNFELLMDDHINQLGKVPDVILIHNNRYDFRPIGSKLIEFKEKHGCEIGVSNFTPENIHQYFINYGEYPAYNEIEINPNYHPDATINYCREHNIKIIAYCVLGGKYQVDRMIKYYTLPHLINYASKLADHVILRSDCEEHWYQMLNAYDPDAPTPLIKDHNYGDKILEPMSYSTPYFYSFENGYVTYHGNNRTNKFVYTNEATDLVEGYKDYDCDGIEEIKEKLSHLEFISDMRVLLRCLLREKGLRARHSEVTPECITVDNKIINIYIVDHNKELTKINGNNNKILIKEVGAF